MCTAIAVIDHARLCFAGAPQALFKEQHAANMVDAFMSLVERAAMLPSQAP
jgi:hypothetical protein